MEEFDQKVNESARNQIFAVMYATWCPMCHGMPEKFRQFYESYKDKTNVTFSLIECKDRLWCLLKGARSIPHWVLIKGTNHEFWEFTNSGNPSAWKNLVDGAGAGSVTRLYSNDFEKRKMSTIKGSSYFHLVIQEDHKDILRKYTELADKYINCGCKFTYKIKKITKPSLRVYRSPFCVYKIKGDIGDFTWFIESNKYSHIHRYNDMDIKEINRSSPFALYVIDNTMQQKQFNNFINLSEKYCKSINFGYTTSEDNEAYKEFSNLTKDDIPFIVLTNPAHTCSLISKRSLRNSERLGLFKHVVKNEKCSTYKEGWIKKKDPNTTIFSFLALVGTASIILLFYEVRRLLITMKID